MFEHFSIEALSVVLAPLVNEMDWTLLTWTLHSRYSRFWREHSGGRAAVWRSSLGEMRWGLWPMMACHLIFPKHLALFPWGRGRDPGHSSCCDHSSNRCLTFAFRVWYGDWGGDQRVGGGSYHLFSLWHKQITIWGDNCIFSSLNPQSLVKA